MRILAKPDNIKPIYNDKLFFINFKNSESDNGITFSIRCFYKQNDRNHVIIYGSNENTDNVKNFHVMHLIH